MDIGKLKNNTVFYDGYEGETEIILSVKAENDISLHIWDGYFEDIFGNPFVSENGWTGFTKDYQESTRLFPDGGLISQSDLAEYLTDLKRHRMNAFSYSESADCVVMMIELFEYAAAHSSEIELRIQ